MSSIKFAFDGKFELSIIAVIIAAIIDGLDGRIARLTNTQTSFGEYFDSLSDMICFGLSPAILIYMWSASLFDLFTWQSNKMPWIICFIYIASAAIRLARFNSKSQTQDKKYFAGLASPAAAAVIITFVWMVEVSHSDLIKNQEHFDGLTLSSSASAAAFIAKFPGALGNSLKVSVCDSALAFESTFTGVTNSSFDTGDANTGIIANIAVGSNTLVLTAKGYETGDVSGHHAHTTRVSTNLVINTAQTHFTVGDTVRLGNTTLGYQTVKVVAIGDTSIAANTYTSGNNTTEWLSLIHI